MDEHDYGCGDWEEQGYTSSPPVAAAPTTLTPAEKLDYDWLRCRCWEVEIVGPGPYGYRVGWKKRPNSIQESVGYPTRSETLRRARERIEGQNP